MEVFNRLKRNALFRDSFWSLLGNAFGKGLALFGGIFVARFLGKEVFGEYSVIRTTILTIGMFSTFGLGYSSTKFVADYVRDREEMVAKIVSSLNYFTLYFAGIIGIALFLSSSYIATHILNATQLSLPLKYLAFLVVFNAISTTQIGVLAGLKEFKKLAYINSVVGLFTFVTTVCLTYMFDFKGALLSLVISQIINCIINEVVIRKSVNRFPKLLDFTDSKSLKIDILRFSFPIALQELVFAAVSWGGMVLLVRYSDYGEVGLFNAAMQWNGIVLFIPGILRNVILAHLSSDSKNVQSHKRIVHNTLFINVFCTVVPSVGILMFSSYLTRIYGDTFLDLEKLMFLTLFSATFMSIGNVYSQAFTSLNRNWLMLTLRLIRDLSGLLLFVVLTNVCEVSGAKAMLIGLLFSNVIFVIITVLIYRRIKNSSNR